MAEVGFPENSSNNTQGQQPIYTDMVPVRPQRISLADFIVQKRVNPDVNLNIRSRPLTAHSNTRSIVGSKHNINSSSDDKDSTGKPSNHETQQREPSSDSVSANEDSDDGAEEQPRRRRRTVFQCDGHGKRESHWKSVSLRRQKLSTLIHKSRESSARTSGPYDTRSSLSLGLESGLSTGNSPSSRLSKISRRNDTVSHEYEEHFVDTRHHRRKKHFNTREPTKQTIACQTSPISLRKFSSSKREGKSFAVSDETSEFDYPLSQLKLEYPYRSDVHSSNIPTTQNSVETSATEKLKESPDPQQGQRMININIDNYERPSKSTGAQIFNANGTIVIVSATPQIPPPDKTPNTQKGENSNSSNTSDKPTNRNCFEKQRNGNNVSLEENICNASENLNDNERLKSDKTHGGILQTKESNNFVEENRLENCRKQTPSSEDALNPHENKSHLLTPIVELEQELPRSQEGQDKESINNSSIQLGTSTKDNQVQSKCNYQADLNLDSNSSSRDQLKHSSKESGPNIENDQDDSDTKSEIGCNGQVKQIPEECHNVSSSTEASPTNTAGNDSGIVILNSEQSSREQSDTHDSLLEENFVKLTSNCSLRRRKSSLEEETFETGISAESNVPDDQLSCNPKTDNVNIVQNDDKTPKESSDLNIQTQITSSKDVDKLSDPEEIPKKNVTPKVESEDVSDQKQIFSPSKDKNQPGEKTVKFKESQNLLDKCKHELSEEAHLGQAVLNVIQSWKESAIVKSFNRNKRVTTMDRQMNTDDGQENGSRSSTHRNQKPDENEQHSSTYEGTSDTVSLGSGTISNVGYNTRTASEVHDSKPKQIEIVIRNPLQKTEDKTDGRNSSIKIIIRFPTATKSHLNDSPLDTPIISNDEKLNITEEEDENDTQDEPKDSVSFIHTPCSVSPAEEETIAETETTHFDTPVELPPLKAATRKGKASGRTRVRDSPAGKRQLTSQVTLERTSVMSAAIQMREVDGVYCSNKGIFVGHDRKLYSTFKDASETSRVDQILENLKQMRKGIIGKKQSGLEHATYRRSSILKSKEFVYNETDDEAFQIQLETFRRGGSKTPKLRRKVSLASKIYAPMRSRKARAYSNLHKKLTSST